MLEIKELKRIIKEKDKISFVNLLTEMQVLGKERVKLIGNNLRGMLGRETEDVDREACIESAKKINSIAEKNGIDFRMPLDWEKLETFLRITLMDDITEEFKKQN